MRERVKVVSQFKGGVYSSFFSGVNVAVEDDYFLEFDGYSIFLPSVTVSKEDLNIFEITVLKLLNVAPLTQEDLSDKLCLKIDFIKNVCDRLVELGLLNGDRLITDAGKNLLSQNTKFFTDENIVPYTVLVTRDTGKIFPKLFSPTTLQMATLDGVQIILNGSDKNKCIFVNHGAQSPPFPQDDFRDMIEKYNLVYNDKIFTEQNLNVEFNNPETVFLHVKTILQNRLDKSFFVSDGNSFDNKFLNSYVCRQPKDILANLQLLTLRR